ncbi:unnamed protein product [Ectocarpus sp. CCAP 1310/34]|nr:unnamed protein product [Ectocarpus sp. CCAP 1310/34]
MYRLKDGTRLNPWPNAARGDCGPYSIIDLRRIEFGATPGTTRVEREQLASIQKLRRDVASLGRARTHRTVEDGQFTDDFLFGTVKVQERPIEQLISNPLLRILKRETWLKVAERQGGYWDGKHMEAAAVVSAKEPVAAKEPTAAKEPAAAKEPTAPEEVVPLDQPVAAKEPTAAKEPAASKEPASPEDPDAPEEPTTAKEPVALKEPAAPEETAAREQSTAAKEPATPEEPTAPKEPTAATEPRVVNKPAAHHEEPVTPKELADTKEPAAAKEPATAKQGGDDWVLVGKNGRPTTSGSGGIDMDERAEKSNSIVKGSNLSTKFDTGNTYTLLGCEEEAGDVGEGEHVVVEAVEAAEEEDGAHTGLAVGIGVEAEAEETAKENP